MGSFRHTHSRLNEFSEEIAFLGGEETEKLLLEREYGVVMKHENRVLRARWWHGCLEEVSESLTNSELDLTEGQGIVKWLWGSFGVGICALLLSPCLLTPIKLGICAIPVFFKLPGVSSNDLGIRTQGNSRIVAWYGRSHTMQGL